MKIPSLIGFIGVLAAMVAHSAVLEHLDLSSYPSQLNSAVNWSVEPAAEVAQVIVLDDDGLSYPWNEHSFIQMRQTYGSSSTENIVAQFSKTISPVNHLYLEVVFDVDLDSAYDFGSVEVFELLRFNGVVIGLEPTFLYGPYRLHHGIESGGVISWQSTGHYVSGQEPRLTLHLNYETPTALEYSIFNEWKPASSANTISALPSAQIDLKLNSPFFAKVVYHRIRFLDENPAVKGDGGFGPGEDIDNDGMNDSWELLFTSDIHTFDPSGDLDGDAIDLDGDGTAESLTNIDEYIRGSRPDSIDSDGDQLSDQYELLNGFNPALAYPNGDGTYRESSSDIDGDGLTALQEYTAWIAAGKPSDQFISVPRFELESIFSEISHDFGPNAEESVTIKSVIPKAINDSGLVVGNASTNEAANSGYNYDPTNIQIAFKWDESSGFEKLLGYVHPTPVYDEDGNVVSRVEARYSGVEALAENGVIGGFSSISYLDDETPETRDAAAAWTLVQNEHVIRALAVDELPARVKYDSYVTDVTNEYVTGEMRRFGSPYFLYDEAFRYNLNTGEEKWSELHGDLAQQSANAYFANRPHFVSSDGSTIVFNSAGYNDGFVKWFPDLNDANFMDELIDGGSWPQQWPANIDVYGGNVHGDFVGYDGRYDNAFDYYASASPRYITWQEAPGYEDYIELLPPSESPSGVASDINNLGDVVGDSENYLGQLVALFRSERISFNLNNMLVANITSDEVNPVNWSLSSATGVNNLRQIVGFGAYTDPNTQNTTTRGFRLTPDSIDQDYGGIGDGMPDDWERYYFGDTSGTGNGDAEATPDGIVNRVEFLIGADPINGFVTSSSTGTFQVYRPE